MAEKSESLSQEEKEAQKVLSLVKQISKDSNLSEADAAEAVKRTNEEREKTIRLLNEGYPVLGGSKERNLYRNDEEVILAGAKQDLRVVYYASEKLRKDPDFAKRVIDIKVEGYKFLLPEAQETLMADPVYAPKIIKKIPGAAKLLSSDLKKSTPLALQVLPLVPVESRPEVLSYFSDEVKDDIDVAIAAVQGIGTANVSLESYLRQEILKQISPRLQERLRQMEHIDWVRKQGG